MVDGDSPGMKTSIGIARNRPRLDTLRRFPAKVSDWRSSIGDALKCSHSCRERRNAFHEPAVNSNKLIDCPRGGADKRNHRCGCQSLPEPYGIPPIEVSFAEGSPL